MAMSQNISLDSLGLKYGTDKASPHHDYLSFYEGFLSPLRDAQMTVLEIGVATGASLKTWEEYFPNSKIVGADIVPESKRFEKNRVVIEILDQSNIEELTQLALKHGPFDIIIEDGSHMWEHQITSLRTLFPFLKSNGIYVVEDLQTNYGAMQKNFKGIASFTCIDYLKQWADLRVGDDQIAISEVEDAFLRTYGRAIQFITFYRRACLIKKNYRHAVAKPIVPKENSGPPLFAGGGRSSAAVSILAHVGYEGDVIGKSGFVNSGLDSHSIQGLAIDTDQEFLEYRVRSGQGVWSEWTQSNGFVGTRGQAKPLTGISVRLKSDYREQYAVRTFCRFAASRALVEAMDGSDCTSKSGEALCGIQVELLERAPTAQRQR